MVFIGRQCAILFQITGKYVKLWTSLLTENNKSKGSKPTGAILLTDSQIVVKDSKKFAFDIMCADRTYSLHAENEAEMKSWLEVLKSNRATRKSLTVRTSSDSELLSKEGFLFKLGNQKVGKKEYAQRWCVLQDNAFYYYKTKQVKL